MSKGVKEFIILTLKNFLAPSKKCGKTKSRIYPFTTGTLILDCDRFKPFLTTQL